MSELTEMTEEQQERTKRRVRELRGNRPCPYCGGMGVDVERYTGALTITRVPGDIYGKVVWAMPCVVTYCKDCGHVDFFEIERLGLSFASPEAPQPDSV